MNDTVWDYGQSLARDSSLGLSCGSLKNIICKPKKKFFTRRAPYTKCKLQIIKFGELL